MLPAILETPRRPDGGRHALSVRRINAERERSASQGCLVPARSISIVLSTGADGSRAAWRRGPTGHIPCDGCTRAPRTLGSRWILLEGPGQVVGHLDLARRDVGLDPDPDAIPDPDTGGLLDLLAEPNIGPPAVHRHGRSEGTSLTVALTLGRAVPYAALTSNGNSTSGSRPSPLNQFGSSGLDVSHDQL
jgi:hypothetical protein